MDVQAIGVIGVEGTPRYVKESLRRKLFDSLRQNVPKVERVWVVANPSESLIADALVGEGTPSVIQLHGDESPDQCKTFRKKHPNVRIWKALRLRTAEDLHKVELYRETIDALLLDAWSPDQLGGTGDRLPLDWLAETTLPLPWWLAGGISAEWIPDLLSRVSPFGLDASSRLEKSPGLKDYNKVQDLVKAVSEYRN